MLVTDTIVDRTPVCILIFLLTVLIKKNHKFINISPFCSSNLSFLYEYSSCITIANRTKTQFARICLECWYNSYRPINSTSKQEIKKKETHTEIRDKCKHIIVYYYALNILKIIINYHANA